MQRIRVLHVNDRLSTRGGADWHLYGVIEALRERGHLVHVAAERIDDAYLPSEIVTQVPGLAAPTHTPVSLTPLLERFDPDIVHIHNVMNPTVLAQGDVMTVQDHRTFCPGRGKWTADQHECTVSMSDEACRSCFSDLTYFQRIHQVTKQRLEQVRRMHVTVLSQYMQRELQAVGVPRITVIPPFVHGLSETVPPEPGEACVLFVGRLVAAKGVWDVVEAWKQSQLRLPLVFAGTGRERSALTHAGFEVLGWLDHQRLSALYRRAAVVVLPSRWQEPFGIVGLEALSLGTPVVAWESGGVAEWYKGPRVSWGDVAGLAQAMRSTIGSRPKPALGFERETLMDRLEAVYHQTVQERSV